MPISCDFRDCKALLFESSLALIYSIIVQACVCQVFIKRTCVCESRKQRYNKHPELYLSLNIERMRRI